MSATPYPIRFVIEAFFNIIHFSTPFFFQNSMAIFGLSSVSNDLKTYLNFGQKSAWI